VWPGELLPKYPNGGAQKVRGKYRHALLTVTDALTRRHGSNCRATDPVALVILELFSVGVVIGWLCADPFPRLAHLTRRRVYGEAPLGPCNRIKVMYHLWRRVWLFGLRCRLLQFITPGEKHERQGHECWSYLHDRSPLKG